MKAGVSEEFTAEMKLVEAIPMKTKQLPMKTLTFDDEVEMVCRMLLAPAQYDISVSGMGPKQHPEDDHFSRDELQLGTIRVHETSYEVCIWLSPDGDVVAREVFNNADDAARAFVKARHARKLGRDYTEES